MFRHLAVLWPDISSRSPFAEGRDTRRRVGWMTRSDGTRRRDTRRRDVGYDVRSDDYTELCGEGRPRGGTERARASFTLSSGHSLSDTDQRGRELHSDLQRLSRVTLHPTSVLDPIRKFMLSLSAVDTRSRPSFRRQAKPREPTSCVHSLSDTDRCASSLLEVVAERRLNRDAGICGSEP